MFIGVGRCEFLVQGATSIKDKRRATKHLVDRISHRFNAAVAEVDYQELWQRGAIGWSVVSSTTGHVQRMLDEIERAVFSDDRIEVLEVNSEVMAGDE